MDNRRTPDQNAPFAANLNRTGGKLSVRSRIPCQALTDPVRLLSSLAAPRTANLHQSSAALSASTTTSRPHLAHSHFTPHHPQSDHSQQAPASSLYPPSLPPDTHSSTSSAPSLPSSMIVSGLSFYDPTQASSIPDYHPLGRWDAPFDPSYAAVDNSLTTSRQSPFHVAPTSNSGSSDDAFNFLQSATGFGFHRVSVPSGSSQFHAHPPQAAAPRYPRSPDCTHSAPTNGPAP